MLFRSRGVAHFELDVGFVEGPVHAPEVQSVPWIRDEMVVVAAASQNAPAGRTPVRALREAVWLLREDGSGTREAADQALLPHLRSYRRSVELGSSEAIKHAAVLGLGFACLSRWVVDDAVQSGRLQILRTTLPKVFRPCYVVLHRAKVHTAAMQLVLRSVGIKGGTA